MADAVEQARALLEGQITELESQIRSLKGALVELGRNGQPSTAPRRRRRSSAGTRSRRAGGKRAPRGQREAQFLAALEKKPGARGSELAKEIGISPNQAYGLAHRLTQSGKIRKDKSGGYVLAG